MIDEIRMLELEEYLMAQTEAKQPRTREVRLQMIRDILWVHRFQIFTYLLMNGVPLPANIICDTHNPRPGNQSVDQPTNSETFAQATVRCTNDGHGTWRCECGVFDECPLGKTGSEKRCTRQELLAARVKVIT